MATGEGSSEAPEYEIPVVPDSRRYSGQLFYATGSSFPIGNRADVLVDLKRALLTAFELLKLDADAAELEKRGHPKAVNQTVQVFVTGYASRAWKGAGNDGARRGENEKLALDRASHIEALIPDLFSDFPAPVQAIAMGGGASAPSPTGKGLLNDDEAQAYLEKRRREINELCDKQVKDANGNAEQIRLAEEGRKNELEYLDSRYGKKSDDAGARTVVIELVWNGHRIAHELPATPKPPVATP
jgi:hypothetical protein